MSIRLPVHNTDELYDVRPEKIVALGLNYRAHIQESVTQKAKGLPLEVPVEPVLFPKTPNVLIGPNEPIVIPRFLKDYDFDDLRTDYEAELAFFILDQCKNVPAAEAFNHIFGYTCMNDVSQRNIQKSDTSGWFRGKSLDTFGPIGPKVVRRDDLVDPQNLNIECRLNGKTVQSSNTKDMIFAIPEIVAFVSKNFTLKPGDIILTGTPAGVGPIKDGDVVEVEIEGIGILSNPVIEK
jgi:2-keto-4-pentenoate hydratase/2-oxohepta-3-ene-1,7-dioic acid hydratase in catechol pathway